MRKQWKMPKIKNLEVNKTQKDNSESVPGGLPYDECNDSNGDKGGASDFYKCALRNKRCYYADNITGKCKAPSANRQVANS